MNESATVGGTQADAPVSDAPAHRRQMTSSTNHAGGAYRYRQTNMLH